MYDIMVDLWISWISWVL